MRESIKWIDNNRDILSEVSDKIWSYAEVGYQEMKSANLLKNILGENGFSIYDEIEDLPTAFVATWGEGKPKIGFLAEYDALPTLSQKVKPAIEPIILDDPGHGCGHNILGAGTLGAVLGLKAEMEKDQLKGTIVFYGCPAEELLSGKVFMARAGVFDDLDLAITWHPMSSNIVLGNQWLAQTQVKFNFTGITAHAAANPQDGRSALDAVELMNIGANYLREHISEKARLHYTITNGGGAPNVVPKEAQSWYFVRAPHRDEVDEVYDRLVKIANGAAMMTETKLDIEFIAGCYNPLPNKVIGDVLLECMKEVGPIEWSEEDYKFAEEIDKTIPKRMKHSMEALTDLTGQALENAILDGRILDKSTSDLVLAGSTDVGDVSWITPLAQFGTSCAVVGTPGHSWQNVAQAGSSIAHKGLVLASKTMALAGSRFLRNQELVAKAKTEFLEVTGGKSYVCPIPPMVKPPAFKG